jgi:hypothetical protein
MVEMGVDVGVAPSIEKAGGDTGAIEKGGGASVVVEVEVDEGVALGRLVWRCE